MSSTEIGFQLKVLDMSFSLFSDEFDGKTINSYKMLCSQIFQP